jgi:hypothetical protein
MAQAPAKPSGRRSGRKLPISPKLRIYRRGDPLLPGGFWTPDQAYIRYCKGEGPSHQASLRPGARVRHVAGSARPRVIRYHLARRRWDVLVFTSWDAPTLEYVVLNPSALVVSRCR